jgi:hypothetical protein
MPDGEYEVRYHPLFHVDVVSAANWYDRHKVGLGVEFLSLHPMIEQLASACYHSTSGRGYLE